MAYRELTYEVEGHVGVITLDRPEARNALTHTTYRELEDAVRGTTARCLVITGADPAFCSGDDVKQLMAPAGDRLAAGERSEPRLTPAADALLATDVPVVAAVTDWQALGRWVAASLAELFLTEDHREGVASFLEKREPHYVGR